MWIKLGQLGKIISYFKQHGLKEAVMAGAITKTDIFGHIEPDDRALDIAARLGSLNDDSFLREVAVEFEKEGISIQPSTIYTPELQAPPGVLTKRSPSAASTGTRIHRARGCARTPRRSAATLKR